jgi:hypothetical protein
MTSWHATVVNRGFQPSSRSRDDELQIAELDDECGLHVGI